MVTPIGVEEKLMLTTSCIARVCHEANKAYCMTIGDFSQVHWDEAPENIKQSAIVGVWARLTDPSITPERLHDKWCEFKVNDGWVHGPVKDAEKKTHPCLVPYDSLPDEQKVKDELFSKIVTTLAPFHIDRNR